MKKTERPRIKIALRPIDWLLEIIGCLALLVLLIYPIYHWGVLPDTIPTNFDIQGNVDAWGNKNSIWILPILGLLMYLGLWIMNKYPHSFNYPQKVTTQNAHQLSSIATRMIRLLNVSIIGLFAYLVYIEIQVALGHRMGLGAWFLVLFLVFELVFSVYFMYKIMKVK